MTLAVARLDARIGIIAVLHTWGQTLTASPPCPLSRPRRRRRHRRRALDRLQAELPAFRPGPVKDLPPPVPRGPGSRLPYAASSASSANSPRSPTPPPSPSACTRCAKSPSSSTPSRHSVAPSAYWPISPATPTARRSPTQACRRRRRLRRVLLQGLSPRRAKRRHAPLSPHVFIRRFLLHVLPDGFHRIRHYGFLAKGDRTERLARCRRLLDVPVTSVGAESPDAHDAHQLTWRDFAVCPRVRRRHAARRQCAALDRPVSLRHFMSPIQRLSSSINIVCGRSSRRHALRRALVRFEALLQQRCSRSSCPMMPPRRSMPNRHAANNVLGRFPDPAAAMTQALSP